MFMIFFLVQAFESSSMKIGPKLSPEMSSKRATNIFQNEVISGPFGKVKTLSGNDFGSFWFLWDTFGTQNDPVEVPEGSKIIIFEQK